MADEPTIADVIARLDRLEGMLAGWFWRTYSHQLNALPSFDARSANEMAAHDATHPEVMDVEAQW